MLWASVPVAAIDKDSNLRRTEDQVGRPAKAGQGFGGYAVAKPAGVDEPTDQPLGLGVPTPDCLHIAASTG